MEYCALGDLVDVQSGYAFKSDSYTEEGHFLVRIGNVQDGFLSLSSPKYVVLDNKTSRFELNVGDILTSLTGNIGRVARVGQHHLPAALNQRVARLTISDEGKILDDYLYYFLLSSFFREELLSIGHGAAQQNVSPKVIATLIIPVPSISEQKRIVAILDQAFADIDKARALTEQNLRNARELFESYLQQVFSQRREGWAQKRLDELCAFSSGGTPSKENDDYWGGSIPWISGRDMKSTRLSDSTLHITQAAVDESSTRMAPAGSILILVRGMGLAHGAQVAELLVPCAFNQDIRGLHPKKGVISRFLVFALRHRINSSDNILSNAAHGTLKINMDELKTLVIFLPSEVEQKEIVENFDLLIQEGRRLESVYKKKLDLLDQLKKSLLQKAFTGELTKDIKTTHEVAA